MKKIAIAMMGLAISSAAMAEPRIEAFCVEDIKGDDGTISSPMGLYNGRIPVNGILDIQSNLAPTHQYFLHVYTKGNKKNSQHYSIVANSERPFPYNQDTSCHSVASQNQNQDQSQSADQSCKMPTQVSHPLTLRMPTECQAVPCAEPTSCSTQSSCATQTAQCADQVPVAKIPDAAPCKEQNANQGKQVPFCDTGTPSQQASIPLTPLTPAIPAAASQEQCAVQAPSCGIVQEGCTTTAESDCHDYVKVRFTGKGHITHSDRIGKLFKGHPQAVSFSHHPKIGDHHEHVNVKCMVTYLGNF